MYDAVGIEAKLREWIRRHGSAAVALSGGVDSSVVAVIAHQELGHNALAVTGVSDSLATDELADIQRLCDQFGINHLTVETSELSDPRYLRNAPDRCYFCKRELYEKISTIARERGFDAVLDGTTPDDLDGHRPGKKAADELYVESPLLSVDVRKADVRVIAARLGLPNATRPSSPCLSSRIAYGVSVTSERLRRVATAERELKRLGFESVRVRCHESVARIEVPSDQVADVAARGHEIVSRVKAAGFTYVTLDLQGLRPGSLLEVFRESPKT